MSNEDLFLQATNELEDNNRDVMLWAKAFTLAEGDFEKAKYQYIKLRVEQLESEQSGTMLSSDVTVVNNSGKNEDEVPEGVKGWSWGAFILNWIWALSNRVWIGLFALIPYVGFVVAIILGFKGREWAWKKKQWEGVEHFNAVQKKWSKWGVGILAVVFLVGFLLALFIAEA